MTLKRLGSTILSIVLFVTCLIVPVNASSAMQDNETAVMDKDIETVIPTEVFAFSDVNEDTRHHKDINQLAQDGVLKGDGAGRFRPDDAISVCEALTIIERKMGDEMALPDAWGGWFDGAKGYKATWFDGALVEHDYTNTQMTYSLAATMILRVKDMQSLPLSLYDLPSGFWKTDASNQDFLTLLVYGYAPSISANNEAKNNMTRAEFCNLVMWATSLEREIPEMNRSAPFPVTFDAPMDDYLKDFYTVIVYDIFVTHLPETLVQNFGEDGYQVRYMDRDEYDVYVSDRAQLLESVAYYSNKRGSNGEIVTTLLNEKTLIHEFAHYVYKHTGARYEAQNKTLFNAQSEVNALSKLLDDNYCTKDAQEFFAEAVVCYCLKNREMSEKMPQTYAMIDAVFSSAK